MASTFGATELPPQIATPAGDIALGRLGEYLATVLNAKAQDAFAASGACASESPVVRTVVTADPHGFILDDCELPALFVFRSGSTVTQTAEDWYEDATQFSVVWMLPQDRCQEPDTRSTFFNTVAKVVASAIRKGRDPAWVYQGDADPLAATISAEPDSIKLPVATSTSAQSYSGGALDGSRAGTTFSPRLQPTATASVAASDTFNTSDPIVWTCVDWYGRTVQKTATFTQVRGGETIGPLEDVAEVVSIDVPAQLSALGVIQFGTGEWAGGRGSDLTDATGIRSMRVTGWRPMPIKAEELDGDGRVVRTGTYLAMRIDVSGVETEDEDVTDLPEVGADVDLLIGDLQVGRLEL